MTARIRAQTHLPASKIDARAKSIEALTQRPICHFTAGKAQSRENGHNHAQPKAVEDFMTASSTLSATRLAFD
jgi:hypothetical protein